MNEHERSVFEAMVKEVGRDIDPATAEVIWAYADTLDPHGIYPEEEITSVGREYFARSPGSDVGVWFGDLPQATREALWRRKTEGGRATKLSDQEIFDVMERTRSALLVALMGGDVDVVTSGRLLAHARGQRLCGVVRDLAAAAAQPRPRDH